MEFLTLFICPHFQNECRKYNKIIHLHWINIGYRLSQPCHFEMSNNVQLLRRMENRYSLEMILILVGLPLEFSTVFPNELVPPFLERVGSLWEQMPPKYMPVLMMQGDSIPMQLKVGITMLGSAGFRGGKYRTIFSTPMKSDSFILLHFTVVLAPLALSILLESGRVHLCLNFAQIDPIMHLRC